MSREFPIHCSNLPKIYEDVMCRHALEDVDDSLSIMAGGDFGRHYEMVSLSPPWFPSQAAKWKTRIYALITLQEYTHNIVLRLYQEDAEGLVIHNVFYPFKTLEDGTQVVNENDQGAHILDSILNYLDEHAKDTKDDVLRNVGNLISSF